MSAMANGSAGDIEAGSSSAAAADKVARHLELYKAAMKGDWNTAKAIYDEYPQEINDRITKRDDTLLHIAVAANKICFVEKLINYSMIKQIGNTPTTYRVNLSLRNQPGNTAFCIAAASGEKELVLTLLGRNQGLAMERGSNGMLPIYMAALCGHDEIVSSLYNSTGAQLQEVDCRKLFIALIDADIYGVALQMLADQPHLATARDRDDVHVYVEGETALHAFARKSHIPSKRFSETPMGFWNRWKWMNSFLNPSTEEKRKQLNRQGRELIKKIWDQVILNDNNQISALIGKPTRLIFTAAKQGNYDFLKILIQSYPDLVFKVDEYKYSIFHHAVLHRHEDIFQLIHEIGSIKDVLVTYKDDHKNNMLHLAAKLPDQSRLNVVPGAALQLQRELLWFEEVKKVVHPKHFEEENEIHKEEPGRMQERLRLPGEQPQAREKLPGKQPKALFLETHEALRKAGEQWMISTANSGVIVAILAATVVFTAAFTVPGGYDPNSGLPVFLHGVVYKLFVIFDALSLIFSTTAVVTFLAILTSRYGMDDFLYSLPNKLMIGLSTLFISLLTMMISFMAAFFVIFNHSLLRIAIPMAVVAALPTFVFLCFEARLLKDVAKSTYRNKSLFKPHKEPLFPEVGSDKTWWSRFTKCKLA